MITLENKNIRLCRGQRLSSLSRTDSKEVNDEDDETD